MAAKRKTPAAARKAAAKKPAPKKAAAKKPAPKQAAAKKPAPMAARRDDYGAPADVWFAKQQGPAGELARKLRAIVKDAAPDAVEALKWGFPFYTRGGAMLAFVRTARTHASIGFFAEGLDDPDGLLEGSPAAGRHVKVRTDADLRRDVFARWLRKPVAR